MGLTLQQLKTYTAGVLKGWFTNKDTLDKLSQSEDGSTLLFDGKEIKGGTGDAVQQIVGRKLYPIHTGTHVECASIRLELPSIEGYDALLVTFGWQPQQGDSYAHHHVELPIEYAHDTNIVTVGNYILNFTWSDDTHILTNTLNETGSETMSIASIYGIKYETVSQDPITTEQVTEAVTETVESLNSRNFQ